MSKQPTGIVNIRGKEYTTVAKRVSDFRSAHPAYSIITTLLERDAQVVLMRAEIRDETGRLLATGHAEEWRKSSEINRTSAIENAETSAIGRALAALGMGGTEFASANEIDTAKRNEQVESPFQGHTAGQANHDEFNALPPEAQAVLREWAADITALVDEGRIEEALAIAAQCESQEDKMALWSQLGSKARAALKKANRKDA